MIDERKNVQTTPTRTYCKRNRPLPYSNLNKQDTRALEVYPAPSHHPTTPENDKKDPAKVLAKIGKYCNPRKNEVLESHRFWSVKYDESQGFEPILTEIRARSDSCNFAEKDRMMRDIIVFSMTGWLILGLTAL